MVQGVTGDGQEDVEEGVVTAEGEHHKVEAEDEAAVLTAPLGVDGRVHHLGPGQVRSLSQLESHMVLKGQLKNRWVAQKSTAINCFVFL